MASGPVTSWQIDEEKMETVRVGWHFLLRWATREALYAEYIMQNAGLDEAQAGIKSTGWNISNLSYADDTTLIAEMEEELKNLSIKVERSETTDLKLNIQRTKNMASGPITS